MWREPYARSAALVLQLAGGTNAWRGVRLERDDPCKWRERGASCPVVERCSACAYACGGQWHTWI